MFTVHTVSYCLSVICWGLLWMPEKWRFTSSFHGNWAACKHVAAWGVVYIYMCSSHMCYTTIANISRLLHFRSMLITEYIYIYMCLFDKSKSIITDLMHLNQIHSMVKNVPEGKMVKTLEWYLVFSCFFLNHRYGISFMYLDRAINSKWKLRGKRKTNIWVLSKWFT